MTASSSTTLPTVQDVYTQFILVKDHIHLTKVNAPADLVVVFEAGLAEAKERAAKHLGWVDTINPVASG